MILKNEETIRQYLRYLGPTLSEKIKNSETIADFGCGQGRLLNVISRDFQKPKQNLWGFDASPDFIAETSKSFPNVSVWDLNFKTNKALPQFDIIFALDVIEHLKNPAQLIQNALALMKNDSWLILCTPNIKSLSFFIRGKNWFGFKDPTHQRFFNKKLIFSLLKHTCLEIVEYKTISDTKFPIYNRLISKLGLGGQIILIARPALKNICVYNIGPGNTELLANKIRLWQKMGGRIKMVCPSFIIPKFKKIIEGIDYIPIPFSKPVDDKIVLIFELLKRTFFACLIVPRLLKNTDVLYSISSVLDELLLPFFLKLIKPKIVWTALFENEVVFNRPGNILTRSLASLFYRLSLLLLHKTDKIFVISESLKFALIKKGFSAEKLILTGNAIDKNEIKNALAQKQNPSGALFLGRLDETKGVFDLIEIAKEITARYPDFIISIAGQGSAKIEKELSKKIISAGLEKNVKVVGFVSSLKKYRLLANSQIFFSPSYDESFGVALLEAVCSGLKAIVYDLPAYKGIYKNQEIITVPLGDIKTFAQKAIEILDKNDFTNYPGLTLLNSPDFSYERLSKIEFETFNKE